MNFSILDNEQDSTQVLLCLHGWMESKYHFYEFAKVRNWKERLILIDLRGHGQSSIPDTGYSLKDYSNDVIDFLDAYLDKNTRITIAGHSMGGMVAINVASLHARITGLILFNSTSQIVSNFYIRRLLDKVITLVIRSDSTYLGSRLSFGKYAKPKWVKLHKMSHRKTPRHVALESFKETILHTNTIDKIKRLEIPILIITGKFDLLLPLYHSKKIAKANVNSKLFVLHNAGHHSMIENAGKVSRIVIDFLDQQSKK